MSRLPPRFYVTGTDTDVGKTVVSALLCHALQLDYFKPIQAGQPADRHTVAALSGARTWPELWCLPRPASPHAAAADLGLRIQPAGAHLPPTPRLLVEGVGGWAAPLALRPALWQADLVRAWKLPVVLVARTTLGTLNHTTLTARAIRADGAELLGLVLVGRDHPENRRDLPELTGAPVLAWIPWVDDVVAGFARLSDGVGAEVRT